MQKIAILGGTGFIGRHLVKELEDDYNVLILSRAPEKYQNLEIGQVEVVKAEYDDPEELAAIFSTSDGIVNLVGESVGTRWTETKKKKIYNSRIHNSRMIAEAFQLATKTPSFLIQGSGMGVYGMSSEKPEMPVSEDAPLATNGFLTKVGVDNENTVKELENITRVVYIRTGIVLDADEGALPQMAMPYHFFMGGPVGNGKQWSSWIHIKDEVRAIKFLIDHKNLKGPFNLTAPHPVTNNQMAVAIGKALGKPAAVHTPAFVLKLMLGEMADELLLNGLKVLPKRLSETGFEFDYETIEAALKDIYKK
ncbi:MAG: TIGR01777 family protein [Marinilabiliales bacterium]|nr:MAG: TIGR01777 family protein [Marinilabiliales bacterium]